MKIQELKMDFGYNGKSIATVWCVLYTPGDIDEIVAWLAMVKKNMKTWQEANVTEKKP